jgi:quinol monooxygenase YgiN
MTNISRMVLIVAALVAATPAVAQAPAPSSNAPNQPAPAAAPSGPLYVITYFEVAPEAARKTGALLRQFGAATHKEAGNVEFTALHETGRPGRFAIVEAWKDKPTFEAHGAAMKQLSDKLQADFASPFDARQFWGLDVFPAGKDQVAAMVKQLTDDSRKDAGALRFDAVVWDGRPNHFHLVEAWAGRSARDAHALQQHTREFRTRLVPFEGALYDERLYEAVK